MARREYLHVQAQIAGSDHACVADIAFVPHFDYKKGEYWEQAAHGRLNRAACGSCGQMVDADQPFLYTNLAEQAAIVVFPEGFEGDTRLPADLASAETRHLRYGWIKGLNCFQELLWMHELAIDDVVLREVERHVVVQNHLDASTELRLSSVHGGTALFIADATSSTYTMPAEQVKQVAASIADARGSLSRTRARRRRYIGRKNSRFDWLDAIDCGGDPALQACKDQLRTMLTSDAPPGDIAPLVAPLLEKFPKDADETLDLFREATGIALSDQLMRRLRRDETGEDAAAAMWEAFAELPPFLRARNALSLEEIDSDCSKHAVMGAYIPDSNAVDYDRISLSFNIIQRVEKFPHALRHEIAHAMHERCPDPINAWLTTKFGWKWFALPKNWVSDPTVLNAPVDAWIEELGGWAVAAPQVKNEADRTLHRKMIRFACQAGPPDRGIMMQSHLKGASDQAGWFGDSVARRVHIQTGADWWKNVGQWVELPIGSSQPTRLAMMNYNYGELAVVDITGRDLVKSGDLPERYAMMSHREFFAEFYASWHDEGSQLKISHPDFQDLINSLS